MEGQGSKKRKNNKKKQERAILSKQMAVGDAFDGYVFSRKKDLTNFHGQWWSRDRAVDLNFLGLHKGTVVVCDENSEEVVLVVKFVPWDSIDVGELEDMERCTEELMRLRSSTRRVTGNGAHKGGGGHMYALGWRGGSDSGMTLGKYVPEDSVKRSKKALGEWERSQRETVPWLCELYRTRFKKLSSMIYGTIVEEAQTTNIPNLAQTEFVDFELLDEPFCGNLTYTNSGFHNSCHKDKDHNTYAYGIFCPVDSDTGKLGYRDDDFGVKEGDFIIPSYEMFVDFSDTNGFVEMIWRGQGNFHCTAPSIGDGEFTRLGSSVQMSRTLVMRVKQLIGLGHELGNDRVRGLDMLFQTYNQT